ncbi:putative enzyme involved in methoxymalonyl-ACP biosynthesis [Lentzea atacamensis]|uniref:Enzyme involved in methoxymalonyl-ACP biosynthesis n=1 Tax=Lentzea atacamensis TaxID=531938 RepID=A0ABX9E8I0_9PSEU|nr:hypothetical protein [Lentzea atacamensis]RAS66001.1 putative enzyme involved in methoxymalonyl-ACP biosynthesis [Lentzea atacamensis]
MSDDLAAVRTRWQEIARTGERPVISIGFLASYTIDPVLPYLGVALHDAGLPASCHTGPYNQIVQQCLDDSSPKTDVLVVAPRFEELGDDLMTAVDAALSAARRRGSFLVIVLPAVPEERAYGHLDDGRAAGTAATAHAVREEVRALLADRPDAWVVDAEQAVRAVGTSKAHHAAMFKFAKIPYTEAVFHELAAQLAGVLRAVYGATPRVVVLDGDSLQGMKNPSEFDGQLEQIHASGARLALRAGPENVDALWEKLSAELPVFTTELVDASVTDCRPVQEQLAALAQDMGVPTESAVLLSWPVDLRRSGLLDRLPAFETAPRRDRRQVERTVSLADFVAGLNVEVDLQPVGPDSAAKVVEVVSRAKDFTLGTEQLDLTEPGREVFAVRVRDRFGDYGISGAVAISGEGVVDVFSLSCVVLGKGVQDLVLRQLPGAAVFRYRKTPHNQITAAFLKDAGVVVEEIS